ncbi:MAG: hypothetical protein U0229_16020 [Anaeromyxobacter sp.]
MASFNCDNCGFTGERLASGACPRCGHVPAGFRVPPLPAPAGQVATEVEPAAEAPPGGYLDLDLGDGGKETGPQATPAPGAPRRRPGAKSAPAFAAVAPKEVPGSAKSILPIVLWVGVACVVLILVGVFFSRGGDEPAAPAPAPVAAAPAPVQPPAAAATPAPAPAAPAPWRRRPRPRRAP